MNYLGVAHKIFDLSPPNSDQFILESKWTLVSKVKTLLPLFRGKEHTDKLKTSRLATYKEPVNMYLPVCVAALIPPHGS